MKLQPQQTLASLAKLLECEFIGDPNHVVSGVNEIHRVVPGDLVFVDHPKYYQKALNSAATTVLIDQKVECPEGKGLLISKAPFDDFNILTRHFRPEKNVNDNRGIDVEIHPTAYVAPNVFLGNYVKIGAYAKIMPGVCIHDYCEIGENVIIGANSVIGHSAFYYKKKVSGYERMHTCGNVVLEKNVEIGALCTIDAGVTATTLIGEGTKIDNQVHIGHDTVVGKNCLMAANVGLAGCVVVEDSVTIWGQVGCASDVTLGEGCTVLAQSGISKDLAPGLTYFGTPCAEVKSKFREMAALRRLPEVLDQLK